MESIFKPAKNKGQGGVSMERLLSLCAVAEHGRMKEASAATGTSPAQLSRQVKELERRMNLRLYGENGLTEEGRKVAEMTRGYVNELESYLSSKTGRNETITIAAGESVLLWLLIPKLSGLSQQDQGRIRFRNMQNEQAAMAVANGTVDLAFHQESKTQTKRCLSKRVGSYGLCLVSKAGALPEGVSSWRDLKDYSTPLATLEGGGSTRALVNELCERLPRGPQIGLECTSHPQIIEACRSGQFMGVVPEIANPKYGGLALRPEDYTVAFTQISELSKQKVKLSLSYTEARLDSSELLQKITHLF